AGPHRRVPDRAAKVRGRHRLAAPRRLTPLVRMTRPPELSDPVAALFPTAGRRRELDRILAGVLEESGARVKEGAVTPTIDLGAFRRDLARFDFATAQPVELLLRWTISQLERGVVHLTHPRYFGLFNPAPTFPAECADRIAAAFNPQLATA